MGNYHTGKLYLVRQMIEIPAENSKDDLRFLSNEILKFIPDTQDSQKSNRWGSSASFLLAQTKRKSEYKFPGFDGFKCSK